MSACSWSASDGKAGRLDQWRRSDPLPILRILREAAIFPPRLLRRLRRNRAHREAREREGHGLCDVDRHPRGYARDARACALQHRPDRYRGGFSDDVARVKRPYHRRPCQRALRALRRPPRALFREGRLSCEGAIFEGLAMAAAIKEDAGDDEHCRHRQHVCECRRGCPLGGFFHAGSLPKPGRDFPWRGNAQRPSELYSEHPTHRAVAPMMSPCGNVDCASVEQYCGGNLTRAWPAADTVLAK